MGKASAWRRRFARVAYTGTGCGVVSLGSGALIPHGFGHFGLSRTCRGLSKPQNKISCIIKSQGGLWSSPAFVPVGDASAAAALSSLTRVTPTETIGSPTLTSSFSPQHSVPRSLPSAKVAHMVSGAPARSLWIHLECGGGKPRTTAQCGWGCLFTSFNGLPERTDRQP